MAEPVTGTVFDVQRFCLHDGPGVRTGLFLKGCGLRCRWCCNPESQSGSVELFYDSRRCIQCGRCVPVCSHAAVVPSPKAERIDRSRCRLCGGCASVCPTGALQLAGQELTVEAALDECLRDRIYYEITGGGVTLSGGEPLLQEKFAATLLTRLKEDGLHTAVETAGYLPWETFGRTRQSTDLYLFDIKHVDPKAHLRGTGKDNDLILDNLHRLSECGAPIVLRYVLLPDYNMDDDALLRLAALARHLDLERLELLSFHRLGTGKYAKLGRESEWWECKPPSQLQLETIRGRLADRAGCRVALG